MLCIKNQGLLLLIQNCTQRGEKRRLDTAKEELVSMKYHPLQERKRVSGRESEHNIKGKKLKSSNSTCETLYTNSFNI